MAGARSVPATGAAGALTAHDATRVSRQERSSIGDLNNPCFGETDFRGPTFAGYRGDTFLGPKLMGSLQLNVRTVIGDDRLIVVIAHPDGTAGAVRIPPEKAWFLTRTFQF